ncbi:uncharacterized protein B0I36DRAFT_361440 [Microdochium trichocladiopsis]|uniref:Uncharacterized protein n=1 Tax=Microdochium trichocladiopsis TaxID=1682393 RepID=A0A9P8Y8D2_9PEZI|nr:uncharacterized protein B0I36DRAFT_361440 [Microdochium trichocladiopsis]KAH7032660.1 hypothetical protein B0I36DRAFT_361440 [Microdochium trichocladiopsis]
MLASYSVQTLSLFMALAMAGPVPDPAPDAIPGPTLSTVATNNIVIPNAVEVPVKIQYYKDYGCKSYNVEFTITSGNCWNYGYIGTHSANAVGWPDKDGSASLICTYFSSKDCQGANHEVYRDVCVSDLTRFESIVCDYYP